MSDVLSTQNTQSDWPEIVWQQVNSLQFGVVQIVVHESKVVQIEKTEKVRLNETKPKNISQLPPNPAIRAAQK